MTREEKERQKLERLGEIKENKFGSLMKIIEYNSARNITVQFQDEYGAIVREREYKEFQKGTIRNPYEKTVCNVGCFGVGKYKSRGKDGKKTLAYRYWMDMIDRCYNPYSLNKRPDYIDVYVCDEWLNFQNFAEWFYENYYEVEDEKMQLDKDILYKGNNIYSPKTCIFVPSRINMLFIKQKNHRGEYPIGVKWHKRDRVFEACCCDRNCKYQYLGRFNKPFQAFYCYKQFKEKVIKQVADEYKGLIPTKLYEAMYRYEIEIND